MKWEIVAHVEEKWTELVPYAEDRLPQLRTLRWKIRCLKRRALSCTCHPDYRLAFNDTQVRIVTAGCPHLVALCGGRFNGVGRHTTTDRRDWRYDFTLTLSKLGHGIFNWRHVAMALE